MHAVAVVKVGGSETMVRAAAQRFLNQQDQIESSTEEVLSGSVRSIVGEFLEHSRIWRFENGGDPSYHIGSADLMDRNLDRRVEAVVPVEDSEAKAKLQEILDLMLSDDRRSWQLQPDASWVRTEELLGRPGTIDTFETLKARALEYGHVAASPRRPGAGSGSLDPRA